MLYYRVDMLYYIVVYKTDESLVDLAHMSVMHDHNRPIYRCAGIIHWKCYDGNNL